MNRVRCFLCGTVRPLELRLQSHHCIRRILRSQLKLGIYAWRVAARDRTCYVDPVVGASLRACVPPERAMPAEMRGTGKDTALEYA